MPYRKFDTGTWQDPWFENLDHKNKLAFIYFWTNGFCNQAGIYEISEKRIIFDLGYGIDMVSIPLKNKVIWYTDHKTVWIKNFFRHQCQNKNFAISALNCIRQDFFKLQIFINYNRTVLEGYNIDLSRYHIDMVSIPTIKSSTEQNRTEQIKETPDKQPVKKQTFKPKAKKNTPAKSAGTSLKKNTDVKNSDFSINLSEVFLSINNSCESILKFTVKKQSKKAKFNPMAWAQKMVNIKKHPGAILKCLDGLVLYWDTVRDPIAYCTSNLKKYNGNFNEAEAIAIHEDLKENYNNDQLAELTAGLIKEI